MRNVGPVIETIQNPGSSDREILAAMLARAFERDPLALHVFPEDLVRQQRLVAVYRLYLRVFSNMVRLLVDNTDETSITGVLHESLRDTGLVGQTLARRS